MPLTARARCADSDWTLSYPGSASPALQVAFVNQPAATINGDWFSKQFTMHWSKGNACRIRSLYETASTGRTPSATVAWGRSHGNATYARRIGTGQLRRGL